MCCLAYYVTDALGRRYRKLGGSESFFPFFILGELLKEDLNVIKQELMRKGLKRFSYIKVELGTPLSLLANESDDFNKRLLEDKKIAPYNCKFDCQDISNLKGINLGRYELSFLHPAILLTNIPSGKLPPNNVMVVPIVSSTDKSKKYKSSYHDFEIQREYDGNLANPFLDNPSIVRLGELRTIGIERINIKETLKIDTTFKLLWHKDRDILIDSLIKVIKLQ
jgi:hypothetical protein